MIKAEVFRTEMNDYEARSLEIAVSLIKKYVENSINTRIADCKKCTDINRFTKNFKIRVSSTVCRNSSLFEMAMQNVIDILKEAGYSVKSVLEDDKEYLNSSENSAYTIELS